MQSNLPPEKVKEMLTEQAAMLDQMVSKMKSTKEEEIESINTNTSKRIAELEKEKEKGKRKGKGIHRSRKKTLA